MASATDLPEDTWGGEAELKQLAGLIGDWVDESPDAIVLTSYRWTDNHRFILGQFTVQIGGKPAMTGSQRIGWDPLKKTIRSWVFDFGGRFCRRPVEPRRKHVGRKAERCDPQRQVRFRHAHDYAGRQRPDDPANGRSGGRGREDAGRREDPRRASAARTPVIGDSLGNEEKPK